jgi:hypothetical protein
MEYIKAFVAGFVATLAFHQGAMALLHAAGQWPKPPFPMTPTEPFKVPAVISLAFWGGVWGVALWLAIRATADVWYWTLAVVLGALGPTIVALFVVFPLKGMPVAAGWDAKIIRGALILNAAWGLGVAVIMWLLAR